jgi:hypothetical protein
VSLANDLAILLTGDVQQESRKILRIIAAALHCI